MTTTIKGDNGLEYEVRGPKPVEQKLDETWFLWLSNDAQLKELMEDEVAVGTSINASWEDIEENLIEILTDRVEFLLEENTVGLVADLCGVARGYTDWRHLTRRLCRQFGIEVSE